MEMQIELPNVLTCNQSNDVVPLLEATQSCKLELANDLDSSDIDIDCHIKNTNNENNLKLETAQMEPTCKLHHLQIPKI